MVDAVLGDPECAERAQNGRREAGWSADEDVAAGDVGNQPTQRFPAERGLAREPSSSYSRPPRIWIRRASSSRRTRLRSS